MIRRIRATWGAALQEHFWSRHLGFSKTEQERKIAWQVQERLFPQTKPLAKTLEYAGLCSQARQVGGDYYDFLNLGRGKLGLVIGDIAGKGVPAALMMANLQANIRSQCATAADEPERFLRLVNQLFYENTSDEVWFAKTLANFEINDIAALPPLFCYNS
jgi:serine phosphatase RsbU (regulator of sigma subunit)